MTRRLQSRFRRWIVSRGNRRATAEEREFGALTPISALLPPQNAADGSLVAYYANTIRIMTDQALTLWMQAFRIVTVCIAFISMIGLMRWFRQDNQRNLGLLWFGYWASLAAQYIPSAIATVLNARKAYSFNLWVVLADIAQSTFLVLVAQALPPARSSRAITRALFLVVPLVVAVAVCAAVNPEGVWTDRLQTLLGFVAFAWFSARWVVRAFPRPIAFLAFFAFLPAAHFVFLLGARIDELSLPLVIATVINLPAYVTLAYLCKVSLRVSDGVEVVTQSESAVAARAEPVSEESPSAEPPAAVTITRNFNYNDVYAFIRDPGEKPGGKFVVAGIAAILFAFAIGVLAILPALLQVLRAGTVQ